jgi:hypothetical protein
LDTAPNTSQNRYWNGPDKPWVWGEIDVGTANWNEVNPKVIDGDARIRMLHNTTWTGLFSPIGTSPLDWFWDRQTQQQTETDRLNDRKATSQFFRDIDYAGGLFTYLMTAADKPAKYTGETVSSDNPTARVYAMRRSDKKAAYLWVQNRNYTWYNSPAIATAISPAITVGNLLNETYKVEIWNTHATTNQVVSTQTQTPTGGSLTITLPAFTNDMAVKIESTNSTPTPTPTAQPAKTGDANGDNKVDGIDYVIWLAHFGQSVSGANNGDFNGSGKVDGIDYVMWLGNYGK